MLQGVKTRLEDLRMVLNQTEDHRQRVLVSVASFTEISLKCIDFEHVF